MASTTTPQRSGGSKNLTEGQKAAIVTLREVNNLTFPQIATKLGVDDKAAGQAFRKAKRDAMRQNSRPYYTLAELVAASKPKHHSGRPAKVANGSELSKSIRADVIQFGDYRVKDAVNHVLVEAGITLCEHTILNIMYNHRDDVHNYAIVRGVRTKKPNLDNEAQELRRDYLNWLIREYNLHFPRLIFVCYDEKSTGIGGVNNRGGKRLISRPRGADSNKFAIHEDPAKFSLMVCAATSTDTNCEMDRPCIVWEQDTDELKEALTQKVLTANNKAKEKVHEKQA